MEQCAEHSEKAWHCPNKIRQKESNSADCNNSFVGIEFRPSLQRSFKFIFNFCSQAEIYSFWGYPTAACVEAVVFLVSFSVVFEFLLSVAAVDSVVDSVEVVVVVVWNELESASKAVNDLVMAPPP